MVRVVLLAGFVLAQAIGLLMAGVATIYWSQDLMLWLIRLAGEERALGAGNVVHVEGGGTLLTNPSAMVRWMLPFWALGMLQISAAVTLVYFWARRSPARAVADRAARTR